MPSTRNLGRFLYQKDTIQSENPMQATSSKDDVSIVKKALDLFQNGTYPETLEIDHVVPLANTRGGKEAMQDFRLLSYDEVVKALKHLEKTGYPIQVETANNVIRFTQHPRSLQVTRQL